MNDRSGNGITGGTGGNTGGTGGPDLANLKEGAGAGAAGSDALDSAALARKEAEAHGETTGGGREGGGPAAGPDTPGSSGDDIANALGGGEGGSAIFGNPAGSGDMDAGRSERTDANAPAAAGSGGGDAGSPGGMGGVRGGMPNPDHRPNGGVSPMQGEKFRGES